MSIQLINLEILNHRFCPRTVDFTFLNTIPKSIILQNFDSIAFSINATYIFTSVQDITYRYRDTYAINKAISTRETIEYSYDQASNSFILAAKNQLVYGQFNNRFEFLNLVLDQLLKKLDMNKIQYDFALNKKQVYATLIKEGERCFEYLQTSLDTLSKLNKENEKFLP